MGINPLHFVANKYRLVRCNENLSFTADNFSVNALSLEAAKQVTVVGRSDYVGVHIEDAMAN